MDIDPGVLALLWLLYRLSPLFLSSWCPWWPSYSHRGPFDLMEYVEVVRRHLHPISSVQLLSRVWLFATPLLQDARPPCPSPTSGVYSNSCPLSWWCHLILRRPLLLLPPIPPSIRVFSNESTLRMRWPKYWSFSFSISPSNEHPGLISS